MQPDLATFQRRFVEAIDQPVSGPLAVYSNTVVHGAVEALGANYPVVAQIVGEEMFESVAVEFATRFPPKSPVLALFGEGLADWIDEQPWADELPYLADVARVERLHVESLFAADAQPLSLEEAREQCEHTGSRLHLHPALRFGWLQTPAMTIWLAHRQPIGGDIAPEWKAEGALFARPTPFVMHTPRIGRAAHRLLCGIRIGEATADCIAAASRLYPDEDCAAVLASLVNLGAFAAPSHERK
ncbi:MAG TPA: DNA-binding domain-containing protein [Sphingomicrobium sp.]|nr:DNA-binding domain-containing protein [Sphingomicrobium sp.]